MARKVLSQHFSTEIVTIGPVEATILLEANKTNRPMIEQHLQRIARQIKEGKWRFNGDTIKVAEDGDVLDGQHRLWAVLESGMPIDTVVVRGITKDAFSTIDTIRRPRSGSDVLALEGVTKHRKLVAQALQWLLRWQSGHFTEYRAPVYRVENSDIERAWNEHKGIARAVERAAVLRGLANPALVGFFYYVLANRNLELAERMIATLENPAGVSVNDPFYRWRVFFLNSRDSGRHIDPVTTIALGIKAANNAYLGNRLQVLMWKASEQFPELKVGAGKPATVERR